MWQHCNNSFVMDTATIHADNLPTLSDTAGVTITAVNPWRIKKFDNIYSGGNYYGALGGTVRIYVIATRTPITSCTGELICTDTVIEIWEQMRNWWVFMTKA